MTRHLVAGLIWLQAASVIPVSAQAMSVVPSIGTSVVFDDNVFHRPRGEGDLSVRFSPRLDALRETDRLMLSGRLELDSDRFAEHPELTTVRGREAATLDLKYAASRRLSFTGAAAFTETETPSDLNEVTALTPGRVRARRLLLHPTASYSIDARTDATVGYLVTADALHGGVGVTTQTASAAIDRHMSERTDFRVEYLEQHFLFGTGQANASRAFTAEWDRQVVRGTTLTLRGGPRVTAGVLAPELMISVRRARRDGSVSLSYQETQTTLIGLDGIARTRSGTAGTERTLGRTLTLRGTSAVVQTRQAALPSLTYRASGACVWKVGPRLVLEAEYDAELQHGNVYALQAEQTIRRNVATVKVIVPEAAAGTSDWRQR